MNDQQKEFLVQELNRFTLRHRIHKDRQDDAAAVEELAVFSMRRRNLILIEAITWSTVLLINLIILLFFRKKAFDVGSSFTFAVLTLGSFGLLLRAMYALGRNRKFRMIVKMLRLYQNDRPLTQVSKNEKGF